MNGFAVFVIAFVTSVLTAVGTVYVIQRYHVLEPRVDQTTVPDLHGLTEKDARTNLEAARLILLVGGREPSDKQKPGTVLRQSVMPGQKVPPDHPVTVVIADEPERAPSVVGLPIAEATQKLAAQGYKVEQGPPIADEKAAEGVVVSQNPAPDSPHDKARPIVLQVSSGGAPVEVPKLVGQTVNNAKLALEKAGLKLAPVRWVSIAETATFVVLSQKPPAGEKVKPGTEIELSANR